MPCDVIYWVGCNAAMLAAAAALQADDGIDEANIA